MTNDKKFHDQLIQRYAENKATDEELEIFFHLAKTGEIDDALDKEMDRFIENDSDEDDNEENEDDEDDLLPLHKKKIFSIRPFLKIAAVITIVFSSVLIYSYWANLLDLISPVKYAQVETGKFETRKIDLTDGSVIFLNQSSKVRYPQKFSSNVRRVELLEGEAFFDVHHEVSKPFIVKTGNTITQVLGTSFNISFYHYHDAVTIAVTKGKVSVVNSSSKSNHDKYVLLPGDKLAVNKFSGKGNLVKFNPSEGFTWTNGTLNFENQSLDSVVNVLKEKFHVEIEFNDKNIRSYRVTAVFKSTDNLDTILTTLCLANNLKYNKIDNRIIITVVN